MQYIIDDEGEKVAVVVPLEEWNAANKSSNKIINGPVIKHKEELLWEEMRSTRELLTKVGISGFTIIISIQVAIFFIRLSIGYGKLGKIVTPAMLPFRYYIVGTVILFALASIFSFYSCLLLIHYRNYKNQLIEFNKSGIIIKKSSRTAIIIMFLMFYLFPIYDLVIFFILNNI